MAGDTNSSIKESQEAQDAVHDENSQYHESLSAASPASPASPELPAAGMQKEKEQQSNDWTTQTVQESLAWMSGFTQPERTANLVEQTSYLSVNRELYHRLAKWTASISSEALWFEGPAGMTEPSQNTLTTAFIINAFQQRNVPIISYFCYYDPKYYQSFSRSAELLKMVFALIYQVSTILPSGLSSVVDVADMPDLSASRLSALKWDVDCLPDAIELLKDMLALGPPLFACCIDGLEILDRVNESERYKSCFNRFIEVLGNARPSHPRILKIWLSTDGHSWTLQDAVNKGWLETHRTDYESQNEPLMLDMLRMAGAN